MAGPPPSVPEFYVLVNTDLEMPPGKIATQVGRAVSQLHRKWITEWKVEDSKAGGSNPYLLHMRAQMQLWLNGGEPIIVQCVTEKELCTFLNPTLAVLDDAAGPPSVVAWLALPCFAPGGGQLRCLS